MGGARRLWPAGGVEAASVFGEEAKLTRGSTRARKRAGDGVARKTAQAAWKQEGHGGIGQTQELDTTAHTTLWRAAGPHERPSSSR